MLNRVQYLICFVERKGLESISQHLVFIGLTAPTKIRVTELFFCNINGLCIANICDFSKRISSLLDTDSTKVLITDDALPPYLLLLDNSFSFFFNFCDILTFSTSVFLVDGNLVIIFIVFNIKIYLIQVNFTLISL